MTTPGKIVLVNQSTASVNWVGRIVVAGYDPGFEHAEPEPHSERGCLDVLIDARPRYGSACTPARACVACDVWFDAYGLHVCSECFAERPSGRRGGESTSMAAVVAGPAITVIPATNVETFSADAWRPSLRLPDRDPDAQHIQRIKDTLMKGGSK